MNRRHLKFNIRFSKLEYMWSRVSRSNTKNIDLIVSSHLLITSFFMNSLWCFSFFYYKISEHFPSFIDFQLHYFLLSIINLQSFWPKSQKIQYIEWDTYNIYLNALLELCLENEKWIAHFEADKEKTNAIRLRLLDW